MAETYLQSSNLAIEKEAEPYIDYFYDKPGSVPGTLSIESDATPSKMVLIDYNQTNATRLQVEVPGEIVPYLT